MSLADPVILSERFGETAAKHMYREYFADSSHLEEFAELFPSYVPTKLAGFHGELYDFYEDDGNFAGAAPRGFSKSTVTDTVYLAYCALNAKRHFMLLFSDTFTQATGLLDGLKSELEGNEMIQWIYGDVRGKIWSSEGLIIHGWNEDDRREKVKILPLGVGMKVRGLRFKQYRPDLAILDDVENDEAVDSPERREKLFNWLRSALLPAMAKDISKIIFIGTLLHRESLLSKAVRGDGIFAGWKRKKWQGILDDGTSLWPERFDIEYLTRMRDDPTHPMYLGPLHFSQEIQNNPISEKDQIIRPEWTNSRYNLSEQLQIWGDTIKVDDRETILRSWLKTHFKRVIGHIDPAISEKEKADYWAMVTIGITSKCPFCVGSPAGHIVLLDVVRFREEDPEVQAKYIGDQFMFWRQDKIKIETVAYQAGLYTLTKNIAAKRGINLPIWKWTPDRSKRRRALLQAGSWAGGTVHLRMDSPFSAVFIEEVVQFPQGEHDDMFDAYLGAAEETVLSVRKKAFNQKPKGM
jgi:phage terminase large subunit-like protein